MHRLTMRLKLFLALFLVTGACIMAVLWLDWTAFSSLLGPDQLPAGSTMIRHMSAIALYGLLLAGCIAWPLSIWLARPVNNLLKAIQHPAQAQDPRTLATNSKDPFNRLSHEVVRLMEMVHLLTGSRSFFNQVLAALPDPVMTASVKPDSLTAGGTPQWRLSLATPAAMQILGCEKSDFLGRAPERFLGPMENQAFPTATDWQALLELGVITDRTTTLRTLSGAPMPARLSLSLVRDQHDAPFMLICAFRPINANQNNSESQTGLSADRFQHLAEQAPMGLFQTDIQGQLQFANHRWCVLTATPNDTTITDAWYDFIHPDDRIIVKEDWLQACNNAEPFQTEFRLNRDHDDTLWVICRIVPMHDPSGEVVGHAGTFKDITDRRIIEEDLRQSQRRLSRAQRIAHLGCWQWDIETDHFKCSDETLEILHIPTEQFNNQWAALLNKLPEEQAAQLIERRDQLRFSTENEPDTGLVMELTLTSDTDRADTTLMILGEAIRASDTDRVIRLGGTIQDISEQRRMEEQLKIATRVFDHALTEAADQLRVTRNVLKNAQEGVCISNAQGITTSVNPAFVRITGYEANLVIDKTNPLFPAVQDHENQFLPEVASALDKDLHWNGEVWSRRHSGEAYPVYLSINAIHNNQDTLTHYITIFQDLTSQKRHEAALHQKTYHDALTDLPNRDLFKDRLQQALQRAARHNNKVALLFFDLDQFRKINESLGHPTGDIVLKKLATRIKSVLPSNAILCRLGGDEFAIIVDSVASVRDVLPLTRLLQTTFAQPCEIGENELHITISTGITLAPDDGTDVEELIRNAGLAVSRAKEAGRNNYQFYTNTMGQKASKRLTLENDMRKALETKSFVLHYQPKLDLKNGRIIGMESLVRWIKHDDTMVSPVDFIPVAEETGLILPLSQWILKEACQRTQQWVSSGHPDLRVAVNISAHQFQQNDFIDQVRQTLDETGLSPLNLELEITESLMMEDMDQAIITLSAINQMGIHISIDDFGTGYSSLNYLKRLPIHTLKIDQSFVRELTQDSNDAAIVSAIISLAHNLKLTVIAEGVETDNQLCFLEENSCDEIQGYYLSKPLSEKAFSFLLESADAHQDITC
ncbi:MAG: EAL domain-containing protein [Magnetococcales bacterium]|nr:EAL domain-containing protein [Magnetococcales bacterium]